MEDYPNDFSDDERREREGSLTLEAEFDLKFCTAEPDFFLGFVNCRLLSSVALGPGDGDELEKCHFHSIFNGCCVNKTGS